MPKKPAQSDSTEQSISFESSLSELENIVTRLESGELPLEDALNEFERGVQLARQAVQRSYSLFWWLIGGPLIQQRRQVA